jgi:two-component system, OmpR family, phosphate regulon sensor histidine kinase PhoR
MRAHRTLVAWLLVWQATVIALGLLLTRLPPALSVALTVVAGLAGILLLDRAIAAPLRRMRRSVDRLSEGDLGARVEDANSEEFATLTTSLNRMMRRLGDQIQSARDAQRTRDLILSSMQEGVLLGGADGRVVFVNPAMERHLGTRPATVGDLYPRDLGDAVRAAPVEGGPVPVDVELARPERAFVGSAVPVGPDGSVLLVLRDVTQSRRLDAVRRDFVTNASHELKTPAAAIQATAETIRLAAGDDPEVIPRFAEQLEREAIRLSRIVADLLDLSRLESGSELAERIELSSLVREETARFSDRAAELGIDLSLQVPRALSVRGSRRDLSLMIRNLVDNAIRYTRPGGRVGVSVDTRDGHAVLRVQDSGIGIPLRELPRIFERFYRVDRARSRETGGTGLGLSIVKHVAENHGGSVQVTSELGRGSRFEVRLPIGDGRHPGGIHDPSAEPVTEAST